jgi:hypothetical protein
MQVAQKLPHFASLNAGYDHNLWLGPAFAGTNGGGSLF